MKRLEAAVEHSMTVVLTPEDCAEILRQREDAVRQAIEIPADIIRDMATQQSRDREDLKEIKAMLSGKAVIHTAGVKKVSKDKDDKKPKLTKKLNKHKVKAREGVKTLKKLIKAGPESMSALINAMEELGISYNTLDKMLKTSPGTAKALQSGYGTLGHKVGERAIIACPELETQLRAVIRKPKHEPLKTVRRTKEDGSKKYTALNKVLSGADKKPLARRISETANAMGMPIHDFAVLVDIPPTDLARYVAGDRLSDNRKEWIENVFSGTQAYDQA